MRAPCAGFSFANACRRRIELSLAWIPHSVANVSVHQRQHKPPGLWGPGCSCWIVWRLARAETAGYCGGVARTQCMVGPSLVLSERDALACTFYALRQLVIVQRQRPRLCFVRQKMSTQYELVQRRHTHRVPSHISACSSLGATNAVKWNPLREEGSFSALRHERSATRRVKCTNVRIMMAASGSCQPVRYQKSLFWRYL